MKIPQINLHKVFEEKSPALSKKIPKFLIRILEKILYIDHVNNIFCYYHYVDGVDFASNLVKDCYGLKLRPQSDSFLKKINTRSIFVANHPLGAVDGLAFIFFVSQITQAKKVRTIFNDLLNNVPQLASISVPFNKYGRISRENVLTTKKIFEGDEPIIIFPAGRVSKRRPWKIEDEIWQKFFVSQSVKYNRNIVLCKTLNHNSQLFYTIALLRRWFKIKTNLEMLLLPHEMFEFRKRNRYVDIEIRNIIQPDEINLKEKSALDWANDIRNSIYKN